MINLPTKEYVISVSTYNNYQVVVEAKTEESALELAHMFVLQGEADLLDIDINDEEIEEINDV